LIPGDLKILPKRTLKLRGWITEISNKKKELKKEEKALKDKNTKGAKGKHKQKLTKMVVNKITETNTKKKMVDRINSIKRRLSIDKESNRSSVSSLYKTALNTLKKENSKELNNSLPQKRRFDRRSTLFHHPNVKLIAESLLPLVEEEKINKKKLFKTKSKKLGISLGNIEFSTGRNTPKAPAKIIKKIEIAKNLSKKLNFMNKSITNKKIR